MVVSARVAGALWRRACGADGAVTTPRSVRRSLPAPISLAPVCPKGSASLPRQTSAGGEGPRGGAACSLCLGCLRGGRVRCGEGLRALAGRDPASKQLVPARAFSVLYWTAGVGSGLVIAGALIALPAVARALRRGAWRAVRRPAVRTLLLTLFAIGATVGLSQWAHSLTPAERNGTDGLYTGAFVGWFVVAVSCLFSWALTAANMARCAMFSRLALRLLTIVATLVGGAMAVMAVATGVWWGSLARVAPWFFRADPLDPMAR